MKANTALPTLLRSFFEDYLAGQRDVSPNTIFAYRDAFKLYLRFAAKRTKRQVIRLRLEDLGPKMLTAFLDHLESDRNNCVATRNCRLIAIHRFFAYVVSFNPMHAQLCRRILDVPIKKTATYPMTYLERSEIKAVLAAPDRKSPLGVRDVALLTFLYNTGARVSETVSLDIKDLRLDPTAQVRILGKGRKERLCPLWPETVFTLRSYIKQRCLDDDSEAPLFLNAHGNRITRHGIGTIIDRHIKIAKRSQPSLKNKRIGPHTFRHTAAMHLLQAGVELNVIRAWLGHVSINTTNLYIEIDMAMKRKALNRCKPPVSVPKGRSPWHSRKDVLQWLHDL